MSFKLDHVYSSDGADLTNSLHTTTLANSSTSEFDGRYLWVTCGTDGVAIFEFWGETSDSEPTFEELDDLHYPKYDSGVSKKLKLVTFITMTSSQMIRTTCLPSLQEVGATISTQSTGNKAYALVTSRSGSTLNAYWIKKCNGRMYVTNGANFGEIYEFDIQSQKFVSVINVQETYAGNTTEFFTNGVKYNMNSNLELANSKLWFVGASFGDTAAQRLYSYDPIALVKTTTDIPVRPQRARAWLANGFNGSIYVANYNNVSVTRFNVDGTFGATIRTNAFPSYMWCGPDRKLYVSSFAGMLSYVSTLDDSVTALAGTQYPVIAGWSDPSNGSKIWYIVQAGSPAKNILVCLNVNDSTRLEMPMPATISITASVESVAAYPALTGETQNQIAQIGIPSTVNDILHVTNVDQTVDKKAIVSSYTPIGTPPNLKWQNNGILDAAGANDFNFTNPLLLIPTNIIATQSTTFQDSALTSHNVLPYMFVLDSGKLLAFRLDREFYREVYNSINGQGAVVESSLQYFGE